MSPDLSATEAGSETRLERRINDVSWGLLLMLTGAVWLVPSELVPNGTWLLGVAVILLGGNLVRYMRHANTSGFALVLGFAALLAAFGQLWRADLPLFAIFLLVMGASLLARPLFARA